MKHFFEATICVLLVQALFSCQGVLSSGEKVTVSQQQTDNTRLNPNETADPDARESMKEKDLNENNQNTVMEYPQDERGQSGFNGNSASEVEPKPLRIVEGKFFAFGLAEGWKVTEDGQFAVVTVAPENNALTIMVGNAGMPVNYPPGHPDGTGTTGKAHFRMQRSVRVRLQVRGQRRALPGLGPMPYRHIIRPLHHDHDSSGIRREVMEWVSDVVTRSCRAWTSTEWRCIWRKGHHGPEPPKFYSLCRSSQELPGMVAKKLGCCHC
jgi:hypothetical protein